VAPYGEWVEINVFLHTSNTAGNIPSTVKFPPICCPRRRRGTRTHLLQCYLDFPRVSTLSKTSIRLAVFAWHRIGVADWLTNLQRDAPRYRIIDRNRPHLMHSMRPRVVYDLLTACNRCCAVAMETVTSHHDWENLFTTHARCFVCRHSLCCCCSWLWCLQSLSASRHVLFSRPCVRRCHDR